ncbi:DUF4041 domain-containing protein [Anaerovibrio slackiae]|uniref:DUF4041 domain-containing protein n=1 Tax=Anaerovibrio slackiae TaxID=2652309 RepID=UPI003F176067
MLWLKKLLKIATPDEIELNNIRQETERLKSEIEDMQNIKSSMQSEISAIEYELKEKQAQVIEVDERLLLQEVSLYKPVYDFVNSDEYKNRIDQIREQQKNLIKTDEAATGYTDWTVNNDRKAGRKMVNDTKKLLLRAFNSECEHCIEKVKYNNFDTCKKRIETARRTISKLGKIMAIDITDNYYELKIQELHLAFEYQQMKKKEKDALQLLKEQAREEAKLKKEIEEARKKIKKEQTHYKNAIASVEEKLLSTTDEQDKELLLKKLEELKEQSASVEKHIEEIDYRESNQKAGFVYVISNIGSFGEGVFKIGMTRRLDPMERVRELGDASVPFAFDVHAMIFSSDAPKLEAALHNAFSDKKVNMVNTRREFFKVSLNEIKKVIKENFDGSVDFIETADAEQFYESEQIRKELKIS